MKVYLRANGNNKIGYGHLTRMLAFAQAIHSQYQVVLVTDLLPSNFKRDFDPFISEYLNYNSTDDQEANSLRDILDSNDIIIIDGYDFPRIYFEKIKKSGVTIIKISDYPEDVSHANVIINHGGFVGHLDYTSTIEQTFYLGPKYALIRKAFSEIEFNFEKGRIMISLGGAANESILAKIIEEVLATSGVTKIDVVTGMKPLISDPRINYQNGLSDKEMAELMGASEVVICPASSLSYEAATVGTGLIVGMLAENQRGQFEYLTSNELAVGIQQLGELNEGKLKNVLEEYFKTSKRTINVTNQKLHFDGNAPMRLKKIIEKIVKQKQLDIRKAKLQDIDLLYKWTIDPDVRNNAINTDEVNYDNHVNWVNSVLNNENRILYIILLDSKPLAQIRFDAEDNIATLSYSIDADFRGMGYGDVVVRKGVEQLLNERPAINKIKAVVQQRNIASNKVFESCNFTLKETCVMNSIDFNIYYKG